MEKTATTIAKVKNDPPPPFLLFLESAIAAETAVAAVLAVLAVLAVAGKDNHIDGSLKTRWN